MYYEYGRDDSTEGSEDEEEEEEEEDSDDQGGRGNPLLRLFSMGGARQASTRALLPAQDSWQPICTPSCGAAWGGGYDSGPAGSWSSLSCLRQWLLLAGRQQSSCTPSSQHPLPTCPALHPDAMAPPTHAAGGADPPHPARLRAAAAGGRPGGGAQRAQQRQPPAPPCAPGGTALPPCIGIPRSLVT